jgi:hypothetical protein
MTCCAPCYSTISPPSLPTKACYLSNWLVFSVLLCVNKYVVAAELKSAPFFSPHVVLYARIHFRCALGFIAFKLLGGRFWAISPSSYTNLGSFARPKLSIAATERYATTSQRAAVERIGRAMGCHTCGSRRILTRAANGVKFYGDHMPPKSVANQLNQQWLRKLLGRTVTFRFFPQCVPCSHTQGGILSKASARAITHGTNLAGAGGGSQAYFHGFRPRPNHLAGGAIAAVAVVGVGEEDIMDGNRWRYASIQRQVVKRVRTEWKDLRRQLE